MKTKLEKEIEIKRLLVESVMKENEKLKDKVEALKCEGCEMCPENSPYQKNLKYRKQLEKENRKLREQIKCERGLTEYFKKAWLDGIERYEY